MAKKLVGTNSHCCQGNTELLTDDIGATIACEFYFKSQAAECRRYVTAIPTEREVNGVDHLQLTRRRECCDRAAQHIKLQVPETEYCGYHFNLSTLKTIATISRRRYHE